MRRSFAHLLLLAAVVVLPSACGLWVIDGDTELTCPDGQADCDNNPSNGCEADLTTKENCGSCGWACDGEHLTCLSEPSPYTGAYCQDSLTQAIYFDEAANDFRGWRVSWITHKFDLEPLVHIGFGGAIVQPPADIKTAWSDPLHVIHNDWDMHCINHEDNSPSIDCWLGPQTSKMNIVLTPTWYMYDGPEVSAFACDDPACDGDAMVIRADDDGIHEVCSVQNSQVTPDTNCALVSHFDPTLKHLDLSLVVP
jgi:hypothetical protein